MGSRSMGYRSMGSRSVGCRSMGWCNVGMDNALAAPCISERCDLSSVVLASSQYAQNIACMQVLKLETYSQFTYHCSHHNLCYLAPQAQPPRYSAFSAVPPAPQAPRKLPKLGLRSVASFGAKNHNVSETHRNLSETSCFLQISIPSIFWTSG